MFFGELTFCVGPDRPGASGRGRCDIDPGPTQNGENILESLLDIVHNGNTVYF